MFVCLLASISPEPNHSFVRVTYGRGSIGPPMASLRCVRPVYIRFYGCRHICTQWTVMEACRIVDTDAASDVIGTPANGPAASYLYWLRRILDDGGRRD